MTWHFSRPLRNTETVPQLAQFDDQTRRYAIGPGFSCVRTFGSGPPFDLTEDLLDSRCKRQRGGQPAALRNSRGKIISG